MKISIASDHGGFVLKNAVIEYLQDNNITIIDQGTYDLESVDYPAYSEKVAKDVINKNADFGILVCTTGIGMSISANKFAGIRAALVFNADCARLSREHNDANIICLGAKYTTFSEACEYVNVFIHSKFQDGRHARRIMLIKKQEEEQCKEK